MVSVDVEDRGGQDAVVWVLLVSRVIVYCFGLSIGAFVLVLSETGLPLVSKPEA